MKSVFTGFLLLIFFGGPEGYSQEVIPNYSDYLTDNLYLLHPSMAGASNMNKIRLTARQQWFGVEEAPSLQTISIHTRVGEKVGVGGIIFNDQNGYHSQRGAYATFAYHIKFSRSEINLNQLSFGINAGLIQLQLDESNFTTFDPLLENKSSDFYGNLDLGLSYYFSEFFAHFSSKNILKADRELLYNNGVLENQRIYLLSSGYLLQNPNWVWKYEPSLMFQWREASNEQTVDLNFKTYRDLTNSSLFGGASYRRSLEGAEYLKNGEEEEENVNLQYITLFAGIEYRNFLFAYTYSQQLNSVVFSNLGFHQVTLGYNFKENRGRYECYCPAVNQRRRR